MPEARLPCPVCLGVKMAKLPMAQNDTLILDGCERCGGMWFDQGEVGKLRLLQPKTRWAKAVPTTDPYSMSCHSCLLPMDRNAETCPACEWTNRLDCPICHQVMERREVQNMHLDFCTRCRGVWWDRIELAQIWSLELEKLKKRGFALPSWGGEAAGVGLEVADFMLWNPDIAVAGARVAGQGLQVAGETTVRVAGVAAEAATHAPEAVGAALEATGDLAGAVFEAVADVVGAIFS